MIFSSRMVQLFAVVLQKDSEPVKEALLREGVLQLVRTTQIGGKSESAASSARVEAAGVEISDLRKRVGGLLHTAGVVPRPPRETDLTDRATVDVEKEKSRLDKIDSDRAAVRERQRAIQQEILKLEDIRRQVSLYRADFRQLTMSSGHSFISMETGKLSASGARRLDEGLREIPSVSIDVGREGDTLYLLLIFMRRDSEHVRRILEDAAWMKVELPEELKSVKEDALEELSARVKKLTEEQKRLELDAEQVVRTEVDSLHGLWLNLRICELLQRIQTHFQPLSRTTVFSGWVPAEKKDRLTQAIREASHGRCYLEWDEVANRGDAETPVRLDNPKFLHPFQMLVSNFGIPRYGTIDPTPVVMPLYLAMFGLMFADVGQGFLLVALGLLGVRFLKRRPARRGYYQLSWLIVWCGLSSVVFGVLFGSVFGLALVPPLWFDFHGIIAGHRGGGSAVRDVYDILAITIYFGISVIALGLIFNWINLIRARRWMELIFDKGGILGGWIYAGGVCAAFYFVSHDYSRFPPASHLFFLAGLPALLLFLKEPFHSWRHAGESPGERRNPAADALDALMKWAVELLEVFSGYLSNTLSFMRVAGLGIAHVSLMISFFALAEMTSGVASILILIFGNALVIALEGLSAGIQALRLSYYEFFTKFFHGTGKLYAPISLDSDW